MIELDLRAFLLSQPQVTGLVDERIYPLQLPQGATLPALTYQTVFGTSLVTHDGPSDLGRRRIQIDCWATGYDEMLTLAEAVRASIVGYRGSMGSNPDVAGRNVNVVDLPEPEISLWRRMVEVSLWHQEV